MGSVAVTETALHDGRGSKRIKSPSIPESTGSRIGYTVAYQEIISIREPAVLVLVSCVFRKMRHEEQEEV
jgi:hypothetical protein